MLNPAVGVINSFLGTLQTHLDGFAEVAWVCVVLKGVGAHQHHIQRHTTAPHVSTMTVVSSALQDLW